MKKMKLLSNIVFAISIIFAVYVLASTYVIRRNIPPGVCPVDNNRPMMHAAIGLLLLSLVLSFVEGKLNKKRE